MAPLGYARLGRYSQNFRRFHSDFTISKLSNGMRIASKRFGAEDKTKSLTFGLWINSGSRDERQEKNGVAHFLEHLIFKGTSNRTKKEIETEVEDLGAHLNAYTTREHTVYQIRCFDKDLLKMMHLLSDIIQNSKLCKSAIERERGVILREMEEVSKSQEELLFDDLHFEAYKNHPLGNSILGPEQNILQLKREDLVDYIRTNYTPEKIVLLGIGDICHETFKKAAEKYFGNFKGSGHSGSNSCDPPSGPQNPILTVRKNANGEGLDLAMGYKGASWTSKDLPVIMLIQSLLGEFGPHTASRVSSHRNQILENLLSGVKDKLVSFEMFNTCYKDTGLLGWYLKTNGTFDLGKKSILSTYARLIASRFKDLYSLISEEDIIRAKRILSFQLASLYEHSSTLFEEIGRDLVVHGRYIDIEDKLRQVQEITSEDLQKIIERYFSFDRFSLQIR
ncbi:putative mitochondrial-processing peptidase subunit beta [Cryptosporidium felis]|nr:putative mitochondrial-processing peptidase subunit beta [Cryptosporidium felis]